MHTAVKRLSSTSRSAAGHRRRAQICKFANGHCRQAHILQMVPELLQLNAVRKFVGNGPAHQQVIGALNDLAVQFHAPGWPWSLECTVQKRGQSSY